MLSPKDRATTVGEMAAWMAESLTEQGVDGSKVVVRGFYQLDRHEFILVVEQQHGGPRSRRRPMANQAVARATVSDEFAYGRKPSEGPDAVAYVMRVIRTNAPHLLIEGALDVVPVRSEPAIPPPSEEDLDEARRIVEGSLARIAQRGPRPSRRRGGD